MIMTAIIVSVIVSAIAVAIVVVWGKNFVSGRIASVESRLDASDGRASEAEERANADRTSWEQKSKSFQERLSSFGSRQADLEERLKRAASSWQQSMTDVEARMQTVESTCEERIHVAVSDIGTRMTTLREEVAEQLSGMQERLERLEEQAAGLRADLDLAQEGITDIGQRVGDLETARDSMQQRLDAAERDIEGKMRELSETLERQNGRLDELRHYLQEVFQRDLHGAMESFDRTVTTVLGEMKEELLDGVKRIERIENAVANRRELGENLVADSEEARRLLEAGEEEALEEGAEPEGEQAETDESQTEES